MQRARIGVGLEIAALQICLAIPVAGQTKNPPGLQPGLRIRVHTHTSPKVATGTLVALEGDALHVALGRQSAPILIPLRNVTTLDVSQGKRLWRKRNVILGGVAGLIIGGVIALDIIEKEPPYAERKATTALVLGPSLGVLAGGLIPSERWERVPVPQRAGDSSDRSARGFRLGFVIRF